MIFNKIIMLSAAIALMLMLGQLSACVSVLPNKDIQQTNADESSDVSLKEPTPPNVELSGELLEQLLIASFAPYRGQWKLGQNAMLAAAETSHDYRLARSAAGLSFQNKDYAAILKASQLWQKLQPDNQQASHFILLSQVAMGQAEAAYETCDYLLEQSKGLEQTQESIREIAGVLIRQKNADTAILLMKQIIEQLNQAGKDDTQALLSGVYVAKRFAKVELAEQWLTSVLQKRPTWDLAVKVKLEFLRAQTDRSGYFNYLKGFVEEHPEVTVIRLNYVTELFRRKKYQEAFDEVKLVLKGQPENKTALRLAAVLAEKNKQAKLSKSYLYKLIAIDPGDDNANWSLAQYANNSKDYAQAEDLYSKIKGEELYFNAQLQIAYMRYHTKGLSAALAKLERLSASTSEQYFEHAMVRHYLLLRENKFQEAFGYINEALVVLDHPELHYARALTAAELGQTELVEQDLKLVLKQQPDHVNALNALGYTLADQTQRYEEAQEYINQALALRPNDAHILDSMGWVLYKQKKYTKAVQYLNQAYKVSPEADVAAHLGEVLWETGQSEKAKEIWQQGLLIDKDSLLLNKTIKRYGGDSKKDDVINNSRYIGKQTEDIMQ